MDNYSAFINGVSHPNWGRLLGCILSLYLTSIAHSQPTYKSVVNDSVGSPNWHQGINAPIFLDRAPINWTSSLAGAGGLFWGVNYNGLNWSPYFGGAMIQQSADEGYSIVMHYSPGSVAPEACYYAAINGSAVFTYHSAPNSRHRASYWWFGSPIKGRGPTPAMIVSGGFSTSSGAEYAYGPQGEFIDAILDSTVAGADCAQSFAHAATAARYAKIKSLTGWTNVFDLRQALRQTCTFYASGWREDGGYGFPLVSNRVGNAFIEATIPTSLTNLDVGPPLLPSARINSDRTFVALNWYNYRQTGFQSTVVKINGSTVYEGNDSNYIWTPPANGHYTADFYTKLSDGRLSRNNISVSLEPYTRVEFDVIDLRTNALSCALLVLDALTNNSIYFTVLGPPDSIWKIQQSSDLLTWTEIGGVNLADGPVQFSKLDLANVPYRFYRASNGECCSKAIGFTRVSIDGGKYEFIANQFEVPSYTIDSLLSPMVNNETLPAGTQVAKTTDGATYVTYTWGGTSWSPDGNATLGLGDGAALINNTTNTMVVTFAGTVAEGILSQPIPNGISVVSSMIPKTGGIESVLGYQPSGGDCLYDWNGVGYDTYDYFSGYGWYGPSGAGEPTLQIGRSYLLYNTSASTSGIITNLPCSGGVECIPPFALEMGLTYDGLEDPLSTPFAAVGLAGFPGEWTVFASDDLVTWDAIDTVSIPMLNEAKWGAITTQFTEYFSDLPSHRYYRFSNSNCCSKIVGYSRTVVAPGTWTFIANQFERPYSTAISELLPSLLDMFNAPFPTGVQVAKTANGGDTYDTYTWGGVSWSPNGTATLGLGDGAAFINPTTNSATVTFGGTIAEGALSKTVPAGKSLLSWLTPHEGGLETDLSYPPDDGDELYDWNGSDYDIYTYFDGYGWYPSEPVLRTGHSYIINNYGASKNWVKANSPPCP